MAGTAAIETTGSGRGRARSNGGIVIAGDRSESRLLAHRHSRRVRLLKIGLPLGATATMALAALVILENAGIGPSLPPVEVPKIVADNLKMQNPHYQGFNSDGGHYWVKAETAQQDLKSLSAIHLDRITGELTDAKKQKTYLTATRGIFDNKTNVLQLFEAINVTGDGGLNAKLTSATIQTKDNVITSDQPSTILMSAGQITSNQLKIRQKTKEYTFVDDVRSHMQPKEAAPAATAEASQDALPFGKPGRPVDVTSNRLDIDDVKKTAIYTGGVVATQDGATMTSPEMTVTYEGSVAPEGKTTNGAKSSAPTKADDSSGTKVKLIVAKDSVVLKQPNGQTATSDQATFNPSANTAVLEGNVILTQGNNRRAVGDRLDYDQASQTMTLTGPVVVTQEDNILKGRRLIYSRETQKMQLSSPANVMGSSTPGRISAHFVKSSAKAPAEASDNESGDGISFGAAFKTDPNSPYDVTSDKLNVDDKAKTAIFTGNVSAVQGAMTMRSQELTAFYTGSAGLGTDGGNSASAGASLTHLTARKKVVVTAKDGQTATGDWAEVDVKKNQTTLGGSVVLTQGKNIVHGNKLVIDMNTGEATIKTEPMTTSSGAVVSESDANGNSRSYKVDRPSAVFYPNQLRKSKISADGWQARTSP